VAVESRTSHRVVVALLDGTRVRGYVYNFSPFSDSMYLFPKETTDRSYGRFLELGDCKAIFFVKTHEGDRKAREELRKDVPISRVGALRGQKMKIIFNDGEEMFASSEAYNPARLGFFAYPLDPRTNNLRIFVVNGNVRQVLTGKALQSASGAVEMQDRMLKVAAPPAAKAPAPSPDEEVPPISAPPGAEDAAAAVPLENRVEAVLRLVNGESAASVSEDLEVPPDVLGYWFQLFLAHGRAALAREGRSAR
jgi:hypothetical protein